MLSLERVLLRIHGWELDGFMGYLMVGEDPHMGRHPADCLIGFMAETAVSYDEEDEPVISR